jgi:medium-chain acyl-[acyl-carrier-protein] hydrolase
LAVGIGCRADLIERFEAEYDVVRMNVTVNHRRALVRLSAPVATGLSLVCFPCAGASAYSYRHWTAGLAQAAQIWAVEYPGRGARHGDRPPNLLADLADESVGSLTEAGLHHPVLFGHSMGALVALLVAQGLTDLGTPPLGLIVAGHQSPNLPETRFVAHELGDAELLEYLRDLDGTPKEIFEDRELLDLLVAIIRSDFRLCSTFRRSDVRELPCPILALGGTEDAWVNRASLEGWKRCTSSDFQIEMFPGGHFFLQSATDGVWYAISPHLLRWLARSGDVISS